MICAPKKDYLAVVTAYAPSLSSSRKKTLYENMEMRARENNCKIIKVIEYLVCSFSSLSFFKGRQQLRFRFIFSTKGNYLRMGLSSVYFVAFLRWKYPDFHSDVHDVLRQGLGYSPLFR